MKCIISTLIGIEAEPGSAFNLLYSKGGFYLNNLYYILFVLLFWFVSYITVEFCYYLTRRWYLSFPRIYSKKAHNLKKKPGCYIFLRRELNGRETAIYVGQSVDVYRRVREHLTGHGKLDLFLEYKSKKDLYIIPIYCRQKKMNTLEKRLIRAFRTRRYYNIQRGGAKKR